MIDLSNKHGFTDLQKRLFKYKENKAKLDTKRLKLERLDCKISPGNSGMPGSTSGVASKVERYVLEKDSLEKDIEDLDYEVRAIDIALNLLTKKEYDILELRYFEGYKPSEVYNTLHISQRTFWREHNKVLEKIEKVINI